MSEALPSAEGLCWLPGEGSGRIAWREPDWLGPVGLHVDPSSRGLSGVASADAWPGAVREGEDDLGSYRGLRSPPASRAIGLEVRAYRERPLLVFRIEARSALDALSTGAFDRPSVAFPAARPDLRSAGGLPGDTRAFGYHYAEFGLPSCSDPSLDGFLLLPEGFRPAVVFPLLLLAPDGRALLAAPLDAFHEQVVAVPRGARRREDGLRAGWHGDLDSVPAGFASELGVFGAEGPRAALDALGSALRARHRTRRPSRYADAAMAKLSYWTDNGAAYWYRTHAGLDMPDTLERAVASVEAAAPLGAVELDSWFYPHQQLRRVGAEGPDDVPPSGALVWEPREDVLPAGLPALRRRLGGKPLVLHARHLSSASPYFGRHPAWLDGERGHPQGPELFDTWMRQAAEWGAIEVEQDWLVECFLGVRGLREAPGRAAAWQRGLDRSAAEHGLHLVWCMATPADFLNSVTLDRIAAIRTSGDYRYRLGSAALWCWFLFGNAFARALGLWPFKDVFLSSSRGEGLDGDPHAEVEALLSALSAGPVAVGDRIGRTDAERVRRTCRADGVLLKPDLPVAALDRCFRAHPHLCAAPLLGETHSRHAAGTWGYLLSLHAWRESRPLSFELSWNELRDSCPAGPFVVYDWRRERVDAAPAGALAETLAPGDWGLRVLCPLLPGDLTLLGDTRRYVCLGDRRIASLRARDGGGLACEVVGAPGERVRLRGWSAAALRGARAWDPASSTAPALERDAASGLWEVELEVPQRGWLQLQVW